MEIKCVKKKKMAYPKINEITDKRIEDSIPDRWLKFGITSFLLNILMQSKVLAFSPEMEEIVDAGDVSTYHRSFYQLRGIINIISIVTVLTFLISLIIIIIKKLKAKKQDKVIKANEIIKIVFIISAILFILSRIVYLIVNLTYGRGIIS